MTRRIVGAVAAALLVGALAADAKPTAGAASAALPAPAPNLRLLLPRTIYAAPGVEANVYFDNVVLAINPANYAFDVTCPKGVQQAERWTFTPKPEEVGEYAFTLDVRDQSNAVIAHGQSRVLVVKADAGAGARVSALVIGDSLTYAGGYTQQLLDDCKPEGNPVLTLIGTVSPEGAMGPNRYEGYGGWTAQWFATRFTGKARTGNYRECGSPFLYADADGKPRLDFSRYCAEYNGGKGPEFVTLLLGCNDTFNASDQTIEASIDAMFKHYDTLLAMIHGVRRDTRIGVILPVPPAATQDAFGANYGAGQTRWQYKRNQHRLMERMVEKYGGREAEDIFLVPAFANLDCAHNYPSIEAPANARTATLVRRFHNGVHPSAEGYKQIGDALYCWMKAQLDAAK